MSVVAVTATVLLASHFGPFGDERHPVTYDAQHRSALPAGDAPSGHPLELAFRFYATFLTTFDGPRCRHRPTCSRYAYQAVHRHGALGILLGVDRLMRQAHSSSVRLLPHRIEGEGFVFIDPLEESTFWFSPAR